MLECSTREPKDILIGFPTRSGAAGRLEEIKKAMA
jgi:hypothetical protein